MSFEGLKVGGSEGITLFKSQKDKQVDTLIVLLVSNLELCAPQYNINRSKQSTLFRSHGIWNIFQEI